MKLDQSFSWVAWNIFLATIPVVLAYSIAGLSSLVKKRPLLKLPLAVIVIVWLAFLPNTCYLLTEWRHFFDRLDSSDLFLRARGDSDLTAKLMAYTVFYFLYSGIGMLFFTLAIRPVARTLKRAGASLWVYGALLFMMISVGVYLGLVLRFNSWDLLNRPGHILDSVELIMSRPILSAFLVFFAAFLWLAYTAIDTWVDGFIYRLKAFERPSAES